MLTILQGDWIEQLRMLAPESVQCCVTSPPYWGLRDYGTATWEGGFAECDHKQGRPGSGRADGIVDERGQRNRDGAGAMGGDCDKCGAKRIDAQLGLEKTPEEYVTKLVAGFCEVRRVLKNDGTLWLNLGDTYAARGRGGGGNSLQNNAIMGREITEKNGFRMPAPGYKQKDLVGIPWMVAFALRADGWYLRSDIIWAKKNCMPESVTDRPTRSHEYIFLLTKSAKYYYDAEAIKEPASEHDWEDTIGRSNLNNKLLLTEELNGTRPRVKYTPNAKQRGHSRRHDGFNDRWDQMEKSEEYCGMRNKRDVWHLSPARFPEAHYATFPPDLIKPCILAGSRSDDTILDPFAGSGTSGMVSLELGRKATLIELNPSYVDLIRQRCHVTPGLALT